MQCERLRRGRLQREGLRVLAAGGHGDVPQVRFRRARDAPGHPEADRRDVAAADRQNASSEHGHGSGSALPVPGVPRIVMVPRGPRGFVMTKTVCHNFERRHNFEQYFEH